MKYTDSIFNKTIRVKKKKQKRHFTNGYLEYIKSPAWKIKREAFIDWCKKTNNHKCWRCQDVYPFYNVHHTSYENLGHEGFGDFELLCVKCHKKEHSHMKISKGAAKRMQKDYIYKHEQFTEKADILNSDLDEQYQNAMLSD